MKPIINSPITIQDVKSCQIYAHLTDEQAQEVINTITQFCDILVSQHQNLFHKTINQTEEETFKKAA